MSNGLLGSIASSTNSLKSAATTIKSKGRQVIMDKSIPFDSLCVEKHSQNININEGI